MAKEVIIKITATKETAGELNFLQRVLGAQSLAKLFDFMVSITLWAVKGVLSGKQVCLYCPQTDTVEVVKDKTLEQLAKLRDEN